MNEWDPNSTQELDTVLRERRSDTNSKLQHFAREIQSMAKEVGKLRDRISAQSGDIKALSKETTYLKWLVGILLVGLMGLGLKH